MNACRSVYIFFIFLICALLSLSYRECVAFHVINSPSYWRNPRKVHEKCDQVEVRVVVVVVVA